MRLNRRACGGECYGAVAALGPPAGGAAKAPGGRRGLQRVLSAAGASEGCEVDRVMPGTWTWPEAGAELWCGVNMLCESNIIS